MKFAKWTMVAALATVAAMATAAEPATVKVLHDYTSYSRPWGFRKVKLLKAEKVVKVMGEYENLMLKLVFEAELGTLGGGGEVLGVEVASAQRSVDNPLNPSDFQIRVKSKPVTGVWTTTGGAQTIRFEQEEYVTQRRKGAAEWPDYNKPFFQRERVKFYSFDAGMAGGYLPWRLYKLDLSDIDDATLEYQSTFAYVQGKVVKFDPKE